jgi:phosphonate transport system permease protein
MLKNNDAKNSVENNSVREYKSNIPSISLSLIFLVITILTIITIYQLSFIQVFLFSLRGEGGFFNLLGYYAFPPEMRLSIHRNIIYALIETLQMALVGTYFGIIISFPMSLMAANNLFPRYIYIPFRVILSSIRTVPSLIWALIFVISFGLGPVSGIIALTVYTIGYIGKFQYETYEGISSDSIQALTALGAGKIQIIRYVVIPESANQLISQIIFMFEYNVRASSIIGFVGAGGIGFIMQYYISYFHFRALFTALIYILIIVVIIDFLGTKLRTRFQDPNFKELNM